MIGETSTALTLYETGGLDIASIPTIAILYYKDSPEYRNMPILRNNYNGFNVAKPPFSSWGVLANDGWTALRFYPHLLIFPAIMIFIAVLAFNILGDELKEAVEPQLHL